MVPQWPSRRGLTSSRVSGTLEERIVLEIDLADGEVVGGAPVGVHGVELIGGERGRGRHVQFGSCG